MHLTQELLRSLLRYEPETGKFFWLKSGTGKRRPEAGNFSRGYVRIGIHGKLYYAHRLAFLYMTGRMPDLVDHKDGDESNCRWDNLRESTHADNGKNSSHRGFHKASRGNKFVAQMTTNYKTESLGTFDTPEEARAAYLEAKSATHAAWATGQGSISKINIKTKHDQTRTTLNERAASHAG